MCTNYKSCVTYKVQQLSVFISAILCTVYNKFTLNTVICKLPVVIPVSAGTHNVLNSNSSLQHTADYSVQDIALILVLVQAFNTDTEDQNVILDRCSWAVGYT